MAFADDELELSGTDFDRVRARVREMAGISLSEAKQTMVAARLGKIVKKLGLASFSAYLDHLDRQANAAEMQDFVNALTTNLTRFYREDHHFAHLSDYVGALLQRRPRVGPDGRPRLRIWSAGCSTGQEAYTIAIELLSRHSQLRGWDFKILATDIDTDVVARAARGRYPMSEIEDLTPARQKLFEVQGGEAVIPASARALVSFKPLNLLGQWPIKGPFDAIFCRNVTIYFDKPTQGTLFGRFGQILAPGGFLYIGHSENIGTGAQYFRSAGNTIYQARSGERQESAA